MSFLWVHLGDVQQTPLLIIMIFMNAVHFDMSAELICDANTLFYAEATVVKGAQ